MIKSTLLTALLSASVQAWMPADRELPAFNRTDHSLDKRAHPIPDWKIRGVNLGGWLISEPWMMNNEWTSMGCSGKPSEFDCVSSYPGGQTAADNAFKTHYHNWINATHVQAIHDAGLNTVRIPIGYWSMRSLVASSEHFPNVDLTALDNVIQKAADLGMFVVIDLHGAPGAQKLGDAFTGQILTSQWWPGFFSQANYNRATTWLDWMTRRIHTTPSYKATIGIIEVVNEPQADHDPDPRPQAELDTLTQKYYPQALAAVRAAEQSLGITSDQQLHVQFMDKLWGSGDPKSNLPGDSAVIFDDHNYVGGAVKAIHSNAKQGDYMYYTCYTDNRLSDGDTPKIVQEWSLTVSDQDTTEFNWGLSQNVAFYEQWFVAQMRLYEQTNGWIFWTWKTELNDPRWDYSYLLNVNKHNWIPTTQTGLNNARNNDTCLTYFGKSDGRS